MSFRYAAPGVYRCDACGAKVLGNMGEPPKGWEERSQQFADKTSHLIHVCVECVAKEANP